MVKNKYPLPLIDSAFEPLHQATVFSKHNLGNAYHLIRIREGDKWKTAFNTPRGHFKYLAVPFGLTNGQMERINQDLKSALRCVSASHSASWSPHLPWIEYAHNSLTCSATGISPFMVSLGFQPPLFSVKVAVPSFQAHLRHCKHVLKALAYSSAHNQRLAKRHRTPGTLLPTWTKVVAFLLGTPLPSGIP